jgi:uncharacterized membrane protein HdeD (DUF308 family)
MGYFEEIMQAVYLLLRSGIIYMAFLLSRDSATRSKSPRWRLYFWAVLVSIGLAVFSSVMLGTHVEGSDPIYDGGDTVVDYEPTNEQRVKRGLFTFTLLVVPILIGIYKGLRLRSFPVQVKNPNAE